MGSFVDELASGNALIQDFDDFVETWHNSEAELPLHTFLGLTWDEYSIIATQPQAIRYVVRARKLGVTTEFPEIIDCACGSDHMVMPKDIEHDDETGERFEYNLVCKTHRKHFPCRPCQAALTIETSSK